MNRLDEIEKRLKSAMPELQSIFEVLKDQWGIAEIKLRGTFLDQNADIACLLELVRMYEFALSGAAQETGTPYGRYAEAVLTQGRQIKGEG